MVLYYRSFEVCLYSFFELKKKKKEKKIKIKMNKVVCKLNGKISCFIQV